MTVTVKGRMLLRMSEAATTHSQVPKWTLGWKLKRALDFAGVSAQDMAGELGVHVATVSRWMNDRETPRRAYVMAWALRTGVPIEWFSDEEGLPRVDSNHQPTGWWGDSAEKPGTAELAAMTRPIGESIDELRQRIRRGPVSDVIRPTGVILS